MQKIFLKKGLVIGIIVLLFGTGFMNCIGGNQLIQNKNISEKNSSNNNVNQEEINYIITNNCISLESMDWNVTLNINPTSGTGDTVVFGEAPDAHDGPPADAYDTPHAPAPPTPYVYAYFNDNLPSPYDTLSKDFREEPDTYKEWNLSVLWFHMSSGTTITITWNTDDIIANEYDTVVLYDDDLDINVANMTNTGTYSYVSSILQTKHFKILCSGLNEQTDAKIIMDDVDIDCCCTTSYAYLRAEDIAEHVDSCSIALGFDPDEVSIISVENYNFNTMFYTIDNDTLYLTEIMDSGYLTGDFNVARIGFTRVGNIGCELEILSSELFTDDLIPNPITHNTIDGYANIGCGGDMNGDGVLNTGDVRWLAIYDASNGNDPNFRPLYADGDVNCDGNVNTGDVRWLAIYYASGGNDPNYSPLYPCN